MGFQPVPNVTSVELVYWNGRSYAENVLHYKWADRPDVAEMESFALKIRTWWVDKLKLNFPATGFLSKIIIKDLTEQFAPGIEYTAGMPLPGNSTSPIMPMNVTVAVRFLTGLRGRSYRGRIYQPCLTEEQCNGDNLDGGMGTILTTAYTDLITNVKENAGDAWVIVSRWENLLPRPMGIATPITNVQVDLVLDSQRRRLLGRGQ